MRLKDKSVKQNGAKTLLASRLCWGMVWREALFIWGAVYLKHEWPDKSLNLKTRRQKRRDVQKTGLHELKAQKTYVSKLNAQKTGLYKINAWKIGLYKMDA